MRHERLAVVLLLAFVVSAAVALMPPRAPAFGVTVATAAQDPAAVESSLGLDRATRRLIQQGLRSEGFDAGSPDGLFGPRTRAAIRAWQMAREHAETGYLDEAQAEALRAAGAPPIVAAGDTPDVSPTSGTAPGGTEAETVQAPGSRGPTEPPGATAGSPPIAGVLAAPAPTTERCEAWNTLGFFETATAEEVTACLGAGADVMAPDDFGRMPLHWAAGRNGNPAVIDALLAAGADVTALDEDSQTPMYRAIWNNEKNPAVIEILLEAFLVAGSDIDGKGATRLHYMAAGNGNPAGVAALLNAGADVTARDEDDRTPLHWAAGSNGNPAVIEVLLAAGADVAALDDSGRMPLHMAAVSNDPAVVEALLAAGADVAALDDSGRMPLHIAAVSNDPAVVEALLAAGADVAALLDDNGHTSTVLHEAARRNENPAVIEVLLAAGADVNARNVDDHTPLYVAMSNRNAAAAEALLAAGADVEARNGLFGATPLHQAYRPATIQVLVAGGADVNARNIIGQTPVHNVSNAAEIQALVAAGADVEARDNRGRTPLHGAGTPVVVGALVAAGADLEARDDRGRTPLHIAWRPEAVGALVAAGANLYARDETGLTPLHSAAIHLVSDDGGSLAYTREGIEALIAAGANLEARDEGGNTPLHLAAARAASGAWVLPHFGHSIEVLLDAGANPTARNAAGETPWDLARANDALKGSDSYWRLNEARFAEPAQESRHPSPARLRQRQAAVPQGERQATASPPPPQRQGPACEIPGYPTPANVQSLGLSWCGSSVGFQRRAFALQAAGAWCAIDGGTSSSPDQIGARHQEINAACDALDAFAAQGGPPCQCPDGYRP